MYVHVRIRIISSKLSTFSQNTLPISALGGGGVMHLAIDRVLRIKWGGPIARCPVLFFSVEVAVTQRHTHTHIMMIGSKTNKNR